MAKTVVTADPEHFERTIEVQKSLSAAMTGIEYQAMEDNRRELKVVINGYRVKVHQACRAGDDGERDLYQELVDEEMENMEVIKEEMRAARESMKKPAAID